MKPVLKYQGGKFQEIPRFIQYIPIKYNRYIEPFFGGGAVFFHLEPKYAIINDTNKKLITFYRQLRDNYSEMRLQLDKLQQQYEINQTEYNRLKALISDERILNANENLYYNMREIFNHPNSLFLESVVYYFINKTAYSGMIRYNSKGEYNVPYGHYSNFNTKLINQQHSELLQRAELFNIDYSQIFNMTNEKDFIFLDPPYDCVFNDYGNIDIKNGFDEVQHIHLAENFKNLSCRTLMIIGKTDLTKELYKEYIIEEYPKNYSINIKNRFNRDSVHMIIKNY